MRFWYHSRETPVNPGDPVDDTPRFLVDAMLGNVARDLRLLGLDAVFAPGAPDPELLRRAQRERRVLVTRDRDLAARARGVRCVLVRSALPPEQVLEVLPLVPRGAVAPMTRCLVCNHPLRRVGREQVLARIPDHVALAHGRFRVCAGCGRVYWPGTHTHRLFRRLRWLQAALLRKGPRL